MTNIIKKNITVYLQIKTIKKLDKLISMYIFPNRSALVNYCLELALPNIVKEFNKIEEAIEINDLPNVLEFLKNHGFVIRKGIQPKQSIPLGNIYLNSNNNKKE